MSIPTKDVKWSTIYNVINSTSHNPASWPSNTPVALGNQNVTWSDGTQPPDLDEDEYAYRSIGAHYKGKTKAPSELELGIGNGSDLLENYWPWYGLYNYGQMACLYTVEDLALTNLRSEDLITAIEFTMHIPDSITPGGSGTVYPTNQQLFIGQANVSNNLFWYRTQANFGGTREGQPVIFSQNFPNKPHKEWNFTDKNGSQPLINGTQKVKLILDEPFIPTQNTSGIIIKWVNNHGKYNDVRYWNFGMVGDTSTTYVHRDAINRPGSWRDQLIGGRSKTWYDDIYSSMPTEYYGKLNGRPNIKFFYKEGGTGLPFTPGGEPPKDEPPKDEEMPGNGGMPPASPRA